MKFIVIEILILIVIVSCKREENILVKNYYSAGVIKSEVINMYADSAELKIDFFILDKTNNDENTKQNILNKITFDTTDFEISIDSLCNTITNYEGPFSTGILLTEGLEDIVNMEKYFIYEEPVIRKIIHTSTPTNEILLSKVVNNKLSLEIINNGFTQNSYSLDQPLADICKNAYYTASDTLPILNALDSLINYMSLNAKNNKKNIMLFCSRRLNFNQNINLQTLINKAKQSNIKIDLIELTPNFTWRNFKLERFIYKLNALTNGMLYETPYTFDYMAEDGELPMDMIQVAGKVNEINNGNFNCFELNLKIKNKNENFISDSLYNFSFDIKISTNYETKYINVPVYFIKN